MIHSLGLSPNGSNERNEQQIKMDRHLQTWYDTQILLERLRSEEVASQTPGEPPPETVSVRNVRLGAPNGPCRKSLLQVTWGNWFTRKVWCHSRKSSPKIDDFPYLFFKRLFVICSARKSIPCSARKSMLYKTCFPTKIPTAHPLLHGFIFSGPWTVVSVSLQRQKGTQGAKFYIPQWPSSTILLRLSDHEKPAFREPQGFLWEPPSTPSFRSFPYHSHTSNKFWIWVAGGFHLLGGSNRRNPLSLKSLLTQKWHYIIGI